MNRFIGTCMVMLMISAAVCAEGSKPGNKGAKQARNNLVGTLIERGIAIGREKDDLKRAGHFEEIAGALAEATEEAVDNGEDELAGNLAEHFSNVAQNGVYANVDKAQGKDAHGLENAIQVHMEHMEKHEEKLQGVLDKAPEAAQKGLRNAIAASQHGRVRSMQRLRENLAKHQAKQQGKGEGKGKPETAGQGHGQDKEKGGQGQGKGKPEDAGQGRGQDKEKGGQGQGKGKSEDAGQGRGQDKEKGGQGQGKGNGGGKGRWK
ncbi:MAG: hypothetical protein JW909_07765 [Planctomycetes bacterium]|nr:hypothetical protein [Planctomycetota bacterium]